jgi:Zn-dependent M16 (insulinase) family peptidase
VISRELSDVRSKMSDADIDSTIEKTKALVEFQQSSDSPEAIASIPLLKLSDISDDAIWFEPVKKEISNIPHLYYNEFTNGIVYMNFWFDLRAIPEDKLPYAALLSQLLGKLDAGSLSYGQLDNALNINTGGFSSSLASYLPAHDDNQLMPEMRIQMKTTTEKLDTSFVLLGSILTSSNFENKDRLNELLKRHQSQLESTVNQNGYGVAATRLESYYSRRGIFAEKSRGIEYYWFITDLLKQYNENPDAVISELKSIYALLFSKQNLIAGITSGEKEFESYLAGFTKSFAGFLSNDQVNYTKWKLEPTPKNEGILTASKVQYVLQGYDFGKLGLTWDGKWYVLNQIMSTDWLQTRVRVIGGAYGGFSSISRNGTISMASYRDPNLKETLDNFRGTIDYLSKFEADSTAMTRYIIGTIAELDYPLTPSQKGDQAFRWYFEGVTRDEVQSDRNAVLATTASDIRNMKDQISKIIDQQVYCVYGNDIKVSENSSLFKNLVKLQK